MRYPIPVNLCGQAASALGLMCLPVLALGCLLPSPAVAGQLPWDPVRQLSGLSVEQPQVDTERAMRSIGTPPWYDREHDQYSPPRVSPEQDNPIRSSGWTAEPDQATTNQQATRSWGSWLNGWNMGISQLLGDWFSAMVLIFLGVLLATIVGLLAFHAFRNYLPKHRQTADSPLSIEIDPTRVVDLPFEMKPRAYENPLQEVERLLELGQYREAVMLLYGYQLLALDQARKIELLKGKTNRMYLRELRNWPELQSLVERSALAFEDAYFGHYQISRERFMSCWNEINRFHELAVARPEAASEQNSSGQTSIGPSSSGAVSSA